MNSCVRCGHGRDLHAPTCVCGCMAWISPLVHAPADELLTLRPLPAALLALGLAGDVHLGADLDLAQQVIEG